MILLQVTFIMLSYTLDLRAFDTWQACNEVKAALEQGYSPGKGQTQRFECVER